MRNARRVILVAEDDENDAALTSRALKRADPEALITIVENGMEAVRYLQGVERFGDRQQYPFPQLLFTDIKMPGMDGFDLLAWLKERPTCAVIPTIVLSASNLPDDVTRAYTLGANAYFRKPSDYMHLLRLLEDNLNYWMDAEIPEWEPEKRA